ncbi:SLC13 family permease [Nocardioides terrisoli]|uniref:SLC13 family permease n=1 Tax=Nocardioides terrisoli TaxID=3388267 RepID=UPI00287BAFF0|nr:SLC13 family permease [Nocardioides marmorisolisilvae]
MLADLVPLIALVVLLAVAYAHPRGWVEAGAGLLAAGATVATGILPRAPLESELRHLAPVVGFLVAILVVANSCRVNGVFAAVGARVGAAGDRDRMLLLVFVTATAVTVALSLDATVVLLTPVVLAATTTRFVAAELACVRLANSASLLVPVANLTNLLAMAQLHLTFGRFAVLMAPSWLVVLAIEYAALRTRHRAATRAEQPAAPGRTPLARFPVAVVALMLAGFVVTSPLHVAPAWVAAVAAVVLFVHDLVRGRGGAGSAMRSAQVPFAVYVLCLGVVVAGLGAGWFGDVLGHLVPGRNDLVGLLLVAALGAVLANVVNNLPATLLLVPLVAPLGTTALLALLIGINVGSTLTWTGSLANLLWRRTLVAERVRVPSREFHATAWLTSPPAIVAGVVVLAGWSRLIS